MNANGKDCGHGECRVRKRRKTMNILLTLLACDQDRFAIAAKRVRSRILVWLVEIYTCQMKDVGFAFTFAIQNKSVYKNTTRLVRKIVEEGDALDAYLVTKYIPHHGISVKELEDLVIERDITGEASYHMALRMPTVDTERLRRNLQIKCPQSQYLVMWNFNVFSTPASGLTDLRAGKANTAQYNVPNIAKMSK